MDDIEAEARGLALEEIRGLVGRSRGARLRARLPKPPDAPAPAAPSPDAVAKLAAMVKARQAPKE